MAARHTLAFGPSHSSYNAGCHCSRCKSAHAEYIANYRAGKAEANAFSWTAETSTEDSSEGQNGAPAMTASPVEAMAQSLADRAGRPGLANAVAALMSESSGLSSQEATDAIARLLGTTLTPADSGSPDDNSMASWAEQRKQLGIDQLGNAGGRTFTSSVSGGGLFDS